MFTAQGSAFAIGTDSVDSNLWLPAIFGDHMVLQQGKDLPVWGKAAANETVVITAGDQTAETKAGSDGKWMVRLKAMAVNHDPVEVKVASGAETKLFKDVLVGDVWLCSGQSNMAMGIGNMKTGKQVFPKLITLNSGYFKLSVRSALKNPKRFMVNGLSVRRKV